MKNRTSFTNRQYVNLSENSLLTVLNTIRELISSSTSCYQRIHSHRYLTPSENLFPKVLNAIRELIPEVLNAI